LRPDLLVKGADYGIDDVVGADFVQARGGKVLLVDLVADQSTTRLLARTPALRGEAASTPPF
jgi:D-beta-D-heptose 7-phosphate kinase / D-beta-D-heptose 1-phosphate adenosyltransferase